MKHNNNGTQTLGRILGMVIACSICLLILLLIFAGIKALWLTLF
jgi:hypothetical protein